MEKRLILASASPRRRELLLQVGISFECVTSDVDERMDLSLPPQDVVTQLAQRKAKAVAGLAQSPACIIGADTVVVKDGAILGKPDSPQHAAQMLQQLSGSEHEVLTGFSVIRTTDGKTVSAFERTRVVFRPLTAQEIDWYVASGEPMDKAGAYGIQGLGAAFVRYIEGDYNNVVGLPVCRLLQCLKQEFGLSFYEYGWDEEKVDGGQRFGN